MAVLKNFGEYIWLLLPSALKTIGKKASQTWSLCKVLGRRFDAAKKAILDVREQSMIVACSSDLLPYFGEDRAMPRLKDENIEQYRRRLSMKRAVSEQAGTNTGIRSMMRSLGYVRVDIEPAYQTDAAKWAEATVWVSGGAMVIDDRDIVQEELDRVKPASALVHLAHEQNYNGGVYFGVYLQTGKIVTMREV